MARLSEYKAEYAQLLLDCMSNGMLDAEIYAALDICKNTFIRWKKEYPDFEEAYERGEPKCEAWWIRNMRDKWLAGDDKGYRYCQLIMQAKFHYSDKQITGITNNTQINVKNLNVLDSKSTLELKQTIEDNLLFIKDNRIIEVKLLDDDSESNQSEN